MKRRGEIDGIRALAIAPVVAFHAWPGALPGGYLGVDSFFVLSGYLITRLLIAELQDGGRIDLLSFYSRRVLRILPALLTMVTIVGALGWWLLLPRELGSLAHAAAATAAMAGNVFAWQTSGYFSAGRDAAPLLHGWSLGVEEQFYLAFPALLWLAHRFAPTRLRMLVVVTTIAAGLLSAALTQLYASAAFYLPPGRAWELGLGAAVALGAFPAVPTPRPRSVLASTGLGLFVAGVAFPFGGAPVPAAVLPAAGAALLLAYSAATPAAALLNRPVLRGLGLISYSLYLWHWPVLSLWRISFGNVLSGPVAAGLVALSLALAILSYRFVEQPLLRRRGAWPAGPTVATGLAASAIVVAGALALSQAARHERLVSPAADRVARYLDYHGSAAFRRQYFQGCGADPATIDRPVVCLRPPARTRNVLVVGDSHAAHIRRAIAERFPRDNVVLVRVCSAIGFSHRECRGRYARLTEPMLSGGQVQAAILTGRWRDEEVALLPDRIRALRRRGVAVTVIGPVAEYDSEVPALLARAILQRDRRWIDRALRPDRAELDRRVGAIATAAGARYFSAYRAECPVAKSCLLVAPGGVPIHFDYGHFTDAGSRLIVAAMPAP